MQADDKTRNLEPGRHPVCSRCCSPFHGGEPRPGEVQPPTRGRTALAHVTPPDTARLKRTSRGTQEFAGLGAELINKPIHSRDLFVRDQAWWLAGGRRRGVGGGPRFVPGDYYVSHTGKDSWLLLKKKMVF